MTSRIFRGLAPLLVAALLGNPVQGASEDETLARFFKSFLDDSFRLQPTMATSLGDHRYDSQLEDVSKASREQWAVQKRQTLKALRREVDFQKLSAAGQVDYQIFEHDLRRDLWLHENTRPFEDDPRVYGSYISDSIYSLLTQSTLPKETNITHAIARMERIPPVIEVAKKTLRNPPKPVLETAIRQNRGALAFFEKELFELVGATPQSARLKAAADPIVAALRSYQGFLEGELMSRATGDWRLGKKRFSQKLELTLDAGFTADQVLADAESEFDRVRHELYVASRQLWSQFFPGQILPPDDFEGRRLVIQKVLHQVNQDHGRPEELLASTQATVDRIKTFIREKQILRLPEPDRCQIIEMPEFRRGNSLAYLQNAPPLDPQTVSFYAVSPPPSHWTAAQVKSFLEEYNQHMLQILTIHEAYPGHYVQLEYANRNPSLIRRILGSGPYIEGWAVYTEQTLLDQGYGDGSLPLRLMQLKFYLRAVANAILDHKMHCTQMTDDEAMRFLVEEAFQSEGEAKLKVIRAKQSSTQLSTYFVGRMGHYRLRQQIQRELGEAFQLARYHEAVLNQGSVPLKFLPALVRAELIPAAKGPDGKH